MRRVRAFGLSTIVLLAAGCASGAPGATSTTGGPGPGATSTAGIPGPGGATQPAGPSTPTDPTPGPTAPATGTVLIHATFTGHFADPLATADQKVEADIVWKTGPDSIHDPEAFTFTAGTFTFSESIGGVCGGTRSEAGPMTVLVKTSLISGQPQDADNAKAVMIDRRIEESLLEFSAFSQFGVPNPDAEGCGPLSRSGVGSCRLLFHLVTLDSLEPDATCESAGSTWTGHLEQTPG
jgi:hypothetical protein